MKAVRVESDGTVSVIEAPRGVPLRYTLHMEFEETGPRAGSLR
jgi:hypothetical protein